jgi:hypothetical protein
MRKNTLMISIVAAMTLWIIPAAHAQSGNEPVNTEDVKRETQELIGTLQKYSAKQRGEALKEADLAIKKLDERIDGLETRADNNWDDLTQSAREKTKANLKALRKQRNELAEAYGSFKSSSAGAWEQMRKGFSDAYQSLSESWEEAVNEYESGNK